MPQPEEAQAEAPKTRIPSLFEQAQKESEDIPPEVEVKVEVEEMTQEEFNYFGTTNLTFHQAKMLDTMRANSRVVKGKGKAKADLSHDPDYSAWSFKVKNIHLPSGTIPLDDLSSGQPVGMNEAADLRRAIQESLELERLERERAEREHLEDLAKIREAEEAELRKLWQKSDEGNEQRRRDREQKP